jgi:hypothetical protein
MISERLWKLARAYVVAGERFDRGVCWGSRRPMLHGSVIPVTSEEVSYTSKFAKLAHRALNHQAALLEESPELLRSYVNDVDRFSYEQLVAQIEAEDLGAEVPPEHAGLERCPQCQAPGWYLRSEYIPQWSPLVLQRDLCFGWGQWVKCSLAEKPVVMLWKSDRKVEVVLRYGYGLLGLRS